MRLLRTVVVIVGLAVASVAAAASVDLAKVGDAIVPGDDYLDWQEGYFCIPRRSPKWTAEEGRWLQQNTPAFQAAFRSEVSAAGLKTVGKGSDLFASETDTAEFLVGAMIKRIHMEVCASRSVKGSATIEVEWQIYSVADAKVVARIPTSGAFSAPELGRDWGEMLAPGAFGAAARSLARDEEFIEIVRGGKHTAIGPNAPVQSELKLTLPRLGAPVPMKTVGRSVVSIFAGDGMGSGVLVSPDGYILTNHHVAGDAGRVRVRWADGTETVGEVVRADRRRDVALVKVAPTTTPALAIRHTEVEVGETVFAIGTPLDKNLSGTLTRGVVSAHRIREGLPFIQSDAAVTHGNSGGPLLDEKGSVVGLTVSGLEPDGAPIGLNFFIPIDDALKALTIVPAGNAPAA